MPPWLQRLMARPFVARLLRANDRYTDRLGNQFAAAVTYFSILSLVPVLMFAFSMLGMTLTVFRPDLLDAVEQLITNEFQNNPIGNQIIAVMNQALSNWASLSVVALLVFAWAGANWVANLKSAIRAQMRPDFDIREKKAPIYLEVPKNLGILVILLLLILIMFALSAVATSLSGAVIGFLHLPDSLGTDLLIYVAPIPISLLVGGVLFAFLYKISCQQPIRKRVWLIGAGVGSVSLVLLQYLASFLWGLFSGNAAASIFGPIIVVMLLCNIFATIVLMVSAWMATFEDVPTYRSPMVDDIPDPAAELDDPMPVVRTAVAQRAVRIGLGTGWVVGAAAGIGLGAIITRVATWFGRRSRDS